MKNFKLFFVAALMVVFSVNNVFAADRSEILKVYNWGDYIDESLIGEFEEWYFEQTGEKVEIIYQIFDINEIMLTKIEKGKEDWDVVCPSEYIIERMLSKDMLMPLNFDFGETPNYINNISPYIVNELNKVSHPERKASDYAVAYMWGTAGLLYNTEYVSADEVKTWGILWDDKYEQKILLKDAYRDIYGTGAIYLHRDELASGKVKLEDVMNNTSDETLAQVEELLMDMKPNIAGWEADFGKEQMTKGELYLNLTWSGDAVWSIEEAAAVGVNLDYYVPNEGSNVWYDGWVIPKYAKNVKAASYFINYMCRPDVALRNMDATGYVSAVATPEILEAKIDSTIAQVSDLSYFFGEGTGADSIHINPVQYPDRAVAERCTMIRDFNNETEKVLSMWSRLKGDNLNTGMMTMIGVIILLIVLYLLLNMMKKRKKRNTYGKRRK